MKDDVKKYVQDRLKRIGERLKEDRHVRHRTDRGRVLYYVHGVNNETEALEIKAMLKGTHYIRVWKSGEYWDIFAREREAGDVKKTEAKTKKTPVKISKELTGKAKEINEEVLKVSKFLEGKNFKINSKELKQIIMGIKNKNNVSLRGATATGKSTLIRYLAEYYGKNVSVINCNPYLESEDIKGKFIAKGNKEGSGLIVDWVKSVIHKALEVGDWVIFEEINFINPALYSALYSLFDFSKELRLTEKDGEIIKNEKGSLLFTTRNEGYNGTMDLNTNPAFKRRVGEVVTDLNYLTPKDEAKILHKKTGIDTETALKITKFVGQLRKEKEDGQGDYMDIGFSVLETACKLIVNGIGSINEALECTLINNLATTKEEKKAIREKLSLFIEGEGV